MIQEVKSNARYYSEFFDFFYRISQVLPEYSSYLLSKRLVGRLLDFYYSTATVATKKSVIGFQEEVRKSDDIRTPPPLTNFQDYLGEQSLVMASHYDDLLEKKLEKNINYQSLCSRMYLWRSVATLLKQCKWRESKSSQKLSSDEQEMLFMDQGFYQSLLEEGESKLAIRTVSDILCSLCVDNQKVSE
jgi:hypothetical protein